MDINIANFYALHRGKYDLFKKQDLETGQFNVIFEVGGKKLYAHTLYLISVSATLDAMLSDRCIENKEEPIEIPAHTYADFYQFITFLYSAQCQLTESNIYAMVDIAEFYGVDQFKDYCYEYLTSMEITVENVFQLKNLANKYSITQLQTRVNDFIKNNSTAVIKSNGFLKVPKDVAKELVDDLKYKAEPEDIFKAVYKRSENQAMKALIANPEINFQVAIKNEISDFLRYIPFRVMDEQFLYEFVVPKAFIFSSLTEMSKILSDRRRFNEGNVKITNSDGQILRGNVIPDKTVLRNIESLKLTKSYYCFWNEQFTLPSNPSPLQKRNGIEWYLFFNSYGRICVQHQSNIQESDYLLAEMTAGITGFEILNGCKIEIE